MGQWSTKDIPSQSSKTAIVTGANSGIGYYTALELGRAGANVIVASRDSTRGQEAVDKMKAAVPSGNFVLELVDLSSQASVAAFAKRFQSRNTPLDLLINNAGIMMLPKREVSPDGYEMQIATNHLGHFLLTGLLMDQLKASPAPRVVNVASLMAWTGKYSPSYVDLKYTDATYSPFTAYGNSKLANLLFSHSLAKKYPAVKVLSAHPGGTKTNLQRHAFNDSITQMMLQKTEAGAWPTLRAATDPNAASGAYFGPITGGMGAPVNAIKPWFAQNDAAAAKLWSESEAATNIKY